MKTNKIVREETAKYGNITVRLTASIDDDCKNGLEDFSLTYCKWEDRFGRKDVTGGGCAAGSEDKYVRRALRKFGLEPVEKVHLSDFNGVPVYPTANAIFIAKERNFESFRDYLRLTDEEARVAVNIDDEFGLYVWLMDNGIIDRWKREANEAIAAIINGRDIEFESKATKPDGHWYFKHPVTEGAIRAQRDLIREGYYNHEKSEKRAVERNLAECLKQIDGDIERSQERINEEEMRIKIKQAMRDVLEEHFVEFKRPKLLIENCIWYSHRNEIAFNWRTNSEKVIDEDYELFAKYLEPFLKENGLTTNMKG